MRLVDQKQVEWKNHAQFFRVAASMMRRVLVDHARKHLAEKRGGGARKLSISRISSLGIEEDADLVAIDEALKEFAAFDPRKCTVVELRFFAGLTMDKIAEILGLSIGTIERDWSMARIWLFRKLGKGGGRESGPVGKD